LEKSRKLIPFLAFGGRRPKPQTTAKIRTRPQSMGSVRAHSATGDANKKNARPGAVRSAGMRSDDCMGRDTGKELATKSALKNG
jgi:hypothetical protein